MRMIVSVMIVSVMIVSVMIVRVIVSVVVRHGEAEAMSKLGKARFKHNHSDPAACRSVCMKIRPCAPTCPPTPP
jgi:hypothetical protein